MSKNHGNKRRIDAVASGSLQNEKGRKEDIFGIYNNSQYYSPDEWKNLSITMKSELLQDPKRTAAKYKIAGDKNISRNESSSSVTETAKSVKESAETTNSVVKALQLSSPAHVRGGAVHFPSNGSNTSVSAASNSAAAMTQIFDRNGDPI